MPRTKFPLTPAQEKELYRLYRLYWREAGRCESDKAYLAGCVMLGSAMECLLLLFIHVHYDEAMKTPTAISKNLRIERLLWWNLADLISVACDAKWLPHGLKFYKQTPKGKRIEVRPKWNPRKAKIGDHLKVLQDIRNFAHPGRYAREHKGSRVTKKYFDHCEEVLTIARDWLLEKIYADLWPTLMPGIPRGPIKSRPKAGHARGK